MPKPFAPQDLSCPDPDSCSVSPALSEFRTVTLPAKTRMYRAYRASWGCDEYNPGYGDTRFSPIDDPLTGARLPSMYLAQDAVAALLETVFHDVQQDVARLIYERDLRGMLLAHIVAPEPAVLVDLRDPELHRLGVERESVVSTPREHYACTRRLAVSVLQDGSPDIHGIIWHSRQAELAAADPAEVAVFYGDPRYPSGRGTWEMFGPGARSIYEGSGRSIIDEIAEFLDAEIVPDD